MPRFFVKFHELDSTKVVVMGEWMYRTLRYVRAVDAPDEETIRSKANQLSLNNLVVEIDEISPMTAAQDRVFQDRLVL